MGTIIALFGPKEQSRSELAARRLIARLGAATAEQTRAGLALLRIVDPVALFPERLAWRHYRGSVDVAGDQEAFDPGHEPSVQWYLAQDVPEELLV